jgi:hypothetical protein
VLDSLKSTADDIGQITELSSEEKVLVSQFFASFLKMMKPLSTSLSVSQSALTPELGDPVQAYVDPTGRLVLMYINDRMEIKDLSEERNRDLMMNVIVDVLPRFKTLTQLQKRKFENRIKTLSSITKEIQKSADALPQSTF